MAGASFFSATVAFDLLFSSCSTTLVTLATLINLSQPRPLLPDLNLLNSLRCYLLSTQVDKPSPTIGCTRQRFHNSTSFPSPRSLHTKVHITTMDSSERLNFINRLNGLTGDQAREVLKQMAINCNTRHTTIARALRNAVDRHAPVQYYPVPLPVPSSPPVATPSTNASSRNKTKVADKRNMRGSSTAGTNDETPAPKKKKIKRGDINPDPNIGRLILDKTTPKTKQGRIKQEEVIVIESDTSTSESDTSDSESSDSDSLDNENSDPRLSDSNQSDDDSSSGTDSADNPASTDSTDTDSSESGSSDSDDSVDGKPAHRKPPRGSTASKRSIHEQVKPPDIVPSASRDGKGVEKSKKVGRIEKARSSTKIKKRKAEEDVEVGHTSAGTSIQGNKKAKTTDCQRPDSDRTCRNCLEVFESRTQLFTHLHLLRHFDTSPAKPNSDPEEQLTGQRVEKHIKNEYEDDFDSPMSPIRSATLGRETKRALSPPPFIKEPNNFPRGPTPASLVLARQRSYNVAASKALPVRSGAAVASSPHAPRPAPSEAFRPQWAPKVYGEREVRCRYCYDFFKGSENHVNACRRHDGEWMLI